VHAAEVKGPSTVPNKNKIGIKLMSTS
jgi:hypothetical protein